jgi:hypothetical protein
MYPITVLVVILGIYTIFMTHNMIPQIQRLQMSPGDQPSDPHVVHGSLGEVVALMIIFHVLTFLVAVCYIRAMATSPGYIPQTSFWKEGDFVILERDNAVIRSLIADANEPITEEDKEVIRKLPVVERKQQSGKFRYCKLCSTFKPDRTHHCSLCNRCILRMDHHCPWVNNCIGYANYKFFLLLLFYVNATLIFVVGAMMPRFINVFKAFHSWSLFCQWDLPVIIAYVLTVFLGGVLINFFYYHLTLVGRAMTTIEHKERHNSRDVMIRRRWEIANIKYNLDTTYRNFKHVLGSPATWLLPINGVNVDEDSGTYRFGPWMSADAGSVAPASASGSTSDKNGYAALRGEQV